jgi:LAO/AO transport system kinase
MGLADDVLRGNQRALARLATHIENDDAAGRAGLARLYPRTGQAHVVGVTGPPGAGKSTLINALIVECRARDRRVGVIAVDPTSTRSGGATLGDRIRMVDWHADPGVFIRSMASRGRTGGLAPATAGMIHLLDAAGFDVVLVETVGVGQEEVDIAGLVHTLVLVQVPGSGDSVQLLKAGLLEFADVFVVNKADLAGAEDLVRGLRLLVGYSARESARWTPTVVRCSAASGDGVAKVAAAVEEHWSYLRQHGRLEERQRAIARCEITDQIKAAIAKRMGRDGTANEYLEALVERVAARSLTPHWAAIEVLQRWETFSGHHGA